MTCAGLDVNAEAFPTCVGMNRLLLRLLAVALSVPHVRGDEPGATVSTAAPGMRSPRAWG